MGGTNDDAVAAGMMMRRARAALRQAQGERVLGWGRAIRESPLRIGLAFGVLRQCWWWGCPPLPCPSGFLPSQD